MAITQVRDPDSILLGLGTLGIAAWSGSSPPASPTTFTDVGYLKGCNITYSRELKDFESAGLLVKRLVFRDRLTMTADYAEVSIKNLKNIIPGTETGAAIYFGGNRTISRYAVRFEHTRSDNLIVTVDIFKAIAGGNVELAFAEEEYITYPVEWAAEADTTRTSGQQYGRIRIAS